MNIQTDDGTLTDEAYTVLVNLAGLPIAELRHRVYNHVPDKMWQLQRWKRGDLVARLFDSWLEQNRHRA